MVLWCKEENTKSKLIGQLEWRANELALDQLRSLIKHVSAL